MGQWQRSRMNGEGRMIWPDGRRFEGQYKDDKRSGHGRFTWPDGRSYDGQWHRGKQHGRGVYSDVRGRSWTGDWANGQKVTPKSPGGSPDASYELKASSGSDNLGAIKASPAASPSASPRCSPPMSPLASPRSSLGRSPKRDKGDPLRSQPKESNMRASSRCTVEENRSLMSCNAPACDPVSG